MTTFYTDVAEESLDKIAAYTLAAHGPDQRDKYLRMLRDVCEDMLPERWARISKPEPTFEGLHRYRADHHIIYFTVVQQHAMGFSDIKIIDILHERQLPSRHLRR